MWRAFVAGIAGVATLAGALSHGSAQQGWTLRSGPVLTSDPMLLDGLMNNTSVIKDGNVFVMYYGAAKGDFSDLNTVMIFRATSTDGVSWQRDSVPVLSPGSSDSWDSVKVETPSVLRAPGGTYLMYYSGSNVPNSEVGFQIGLATSHDGITWTKHPRNPVLRRSLAGFDQLSLLGPSVVYKGGEYWMWYGGLANVVATGLAKSADGVRWNKKGVVMRLDVERESADDAGVIENFVLWNGTAFEMFYAVLLNEGKVVAPIWHATSTDGVTWLKETKPLIDRATVGGWANEGLGAPSVILDGDTYRMWFTGTNTDYATFFNLGIGLAEARR